MADPAVVAVKICRNHIAKTTLFTLGYYSHGMLTDSDAMLKDNMTIRTRTDVKQAVGGDIV